MWIFHRSHQGRTDSARVYTKAVNIPPLRPFCYSSSKCAVLYLQPRPPAWPRTATRNLNTTPSCTTHKVSWKPLWGRERDSISCSWNRKRNFIAKMKIFLIRPWKTFPRGRRPSSQLRRSVHVPCPSNMIFQWAMSYPDHLRPCVFKQRMEVGGEGNTTFKTTNSLLFLAFLYSHFILMADTTLDRFLSILCQTNNRNVQVVQMSYLSCWCH